MQFRTNTPTADVTVEQKIALKGRQGTNEKSGRDWKFENQPARLSVETPEGDRYQRDVMLKLWNDTQPYDPGQYNIVPRWSVDRFNNVILGGFELESAAK